MRNILILLTLVLFIIGCSNQVDYDSLTAEEKAAYDEIVSDELSKDVKLSPGARRGVVYSSCLDSDGADYETQGKTTFQYKYIGKTRIIEKTDYCSNDELREYFCNGLRLALRTHECDECEAGACVE